jgi:predicted ATP-grasp superfamily ATP-dependent carboligase
MILIISHPGDLHTQEVARVLTELKSEPYLLDYSHFSIASQITCDFRGDDLELTFNDDAWGRVDLTTVNAVWWRRPQEFRLSPDVTDHQHYLFAVAEAREVFGGLSGLLDAYWMNVPERDDLAHRKVFQMRMAQRLGIAMPNTLVTNSPANARAFIEKHGAEATVFKPFRGTPSAWRETRLVGAGELAVLDSVRYAPVIFQEYVEGNDIRITVVGKHIFAAEIDITDGDYPVDFRMNYETLKMSPIELPEKTVSAIRSLMERLGLVYGAIDFRRTPEGQYIFLEINPAGQWLFVEKHTGQKITNAVAETLLELNGRHL